MINPDLKAFHILSALEGEGWELHQSAASIRMTPPVKIRERFGLNDAPVPGVFNTAREAKAFAEGFHHALLCQQMASKGGGE